MIGVDMIGVERIKKAAQSAHFLNRVFTPYELDYAEKKADKFQTLAGLYAAKEAAAKALKRGLNGLNLKDIAVSHDENGCPFALVLGQRVELSVSHDGGFAIAIALACRLD